MKLLRVLRPAPPGKPIPLVALLSSGDDVPPYEPPRLSELGHVRDLTLGSSSSGNADANSQYYW